MAMLTEVQIKDIAKRAYYDVRNFDFDCRANVEFFQKEELFDWPGWAEAADVQSEYVTTVNLILDGGMPDAPQRHGLFVANRIALGWKKGAVVDRPGRIHPWLMPFADLPEEMRVWLVERDSIFESSVRNQVEKLFTYKQEGEDDG